MKYSQFIGAVLAALTIFATFLPWVTIEYQSNTVTGWMTVGTNFGKPGIVHVFLSAIALVLFSVPILWAKRVNLFIVALNFAWTIRNSLVLTACFAGECPVKRYGLYMLIVASLGMLLMSMLPKGYSKNKM